MRDSLDNNKNANESLKLHLSIDVPATSSAESLESAPRIVFRWMVCSVQCVLFTWGICCSSICASLSIAGGQNVQSQLLRRCYYCTKLLEVEREPVNSNSWVLSRNGVTVVDSQSNRSSDRTSGQYLASFWRPQQKTSIHIAIYFNSPINSEIAGRCQCPCKRRSLNGLEFQDSLLIGINSCKNLSQRLGYNRSNASIIN